MVLERVLENSGLRLGEEYLREETLQKRQWEKYRPDVIVNLPANKASYHRCKSTIDKL